MVSAGDLAAAWGVRPVALRPGGSIRLNPLDAGPERPGEDGPSGTARRQMELLTSLACACPARNLLPRERAALGLALAFAPIFIANLVFAQRFKDVASSTTAFGANLLGAIVGGVLEYLSLITGFRLLLVVVAAFYGLAFVFGRRHLAQRS